MADQPPKQTIVANPADIDAIVAKYRALGYTVTGGPQTPEAIAADLLKVITARAPAAAQLADAPTMSAVARSYFQEGVSAYLVGLDLAACLASLSACEAVLRDVIHDACSSTQQNLAILDAVVLQELEKMTLYPLAHCALELSLISKDVRQHLTEVVGPFRNPLSHGNAAQLARKAGGPDFTARSTVINVATFEESEQVLNLRDRLVLAPLLNEFARRSAYPALQLVTELQLHAAHNLAGLVRPTSFPAQFTQAYKREQNEARKRSCSTPTTKDSSGG